MSTFLSDFVRVFDNAIPATLCDEVVKRFQTSTGIIEGAVGTEQGPHRPDVRSCLDLNLTKECSELNPYLTQALQQTVNLYRQNITGYIFPERFAYEQFRAKKYRVGDQVKDHFSYHIDVNSYASARRFLSMLWYCNDVAEGGETVFPHQGITVRPKKGRVLVFPPLWLYPHSGEQPISNEKVIVSSYLHYL